MSDNANSTLLTSLGANPLPATIDPIVEELLEIPEDGTTDEDFQLARENMLFIMNHTKNAIGKLSSIADQSQQARAYEVLSNLINTFMLQQKDLLDIRKKRSEVRKEEAAPGSNVQTTDGPKELHNHLHVGSTAELQNLLEKIKNGN